MAHLKPVPSPQTIRSRLGLPRKALLKAAHRFVDVDRRLARLRRDLERRAQHIGQHAVFGQDPELGAGGQVPISYAQAQATASLSRRATLRAIFPDSREPQLILALALTGWVQDLQGLSRRTRVSSAEVQSCYGAGLRVQTMFERLCPVEGPGPGGHLANAILVDGFLPPLNRDEGCSHIEDGFRRTLQKGLNPEAAFVAGERALLALTHVLVSMVETANGAVLKLTRAATGLEQAVASELWAPRFGPTGGSLPRSPRYWS